MVSGDIWWVRVGSLSELIKWGLMEQPLTQVNRLDYSSGHVWHEHRSRGEGRACDVVTQIVGWVGGGALHWFSGGQGLHGIGRARCLSGRRWETSRCSLCSATQSLSLPVPSLLYRVPGVATGGTLVGFLQYDLL